MRSQVERVEWNRARKAASTRKQLKASRTGALSRNLEPKVRVEMVCVREVRFGQGRAAGLGNGNGEATCAEKLWLYLLAQLSWMPSQALDGSSRFTNAGTGAIGTGASLWPHLLTLHASLGVAVCTEAFRARFSRGSLIAPALRPTRIKQSAPQRE